MTEHENERRWFKRFGRRGGPPGEIRLFCFHHAGGNAAAYRRWATLMPAGIETVAVQLPGRADRFHEPAHDDMALLLDDLVEAMEPLLDRPFACYGASMGAQVAWALAHFLRERALPMPRKLFLAARASPGTADDAWDQEDRGGLKGLLRSMGGTPSEVLDEPEILSMLLPTLRADMSVLLTHDPYPAVPLEVPIRAFAGAADSSASPANMAGWRSATRGAFDLEVVSSGHFFDAAAEEQVVRSIARSLS